MAERGADALTREAVARAFSGHDIDAIIDRIAADAGWTVAGHAPLVGRDSIVGACRRTQAEIADAETTWLTFVSTGDGDLVAVHTVARYVDPDGTSTVSSCDLLEFADGQVVAITSYAVEVDQGG